MYSYAKLYMYTHIIHVSYSSSHISFSSLGAPPLGAGSRRPPPSPRRAPPAARPRAAPRRFGRPGAWPDGAPGAGEDRWILDDFSGDNYGIYGKSMGNLWEICGKPKSGVNLWNSMISW